MTTSLKNYQEFVQLYSLSTISVLMRIPRLSHVRLTTDLSYFFQSFYVV